MTHEGTITDAELAARVRLAIERLETGNYNPATQALDTFVAFIHAARRWLADHPADDGEPILLSWLRETGWRHGPASFGSPCGRLWLDDWMGQDFKELRFVPTNGPITMVRTKAQLRRLCAALGVPLTEPGSTADNPPDRVPSAQTTEAPAHEPQVPRRADQRSV